MGSFSLRERLCLRDEIVPLVKKEEYFSDMHCVAPAMPGATYKWSLLDLATTRKPYHMRWLEQGLGLPCQWWRNEQASVLPLLQEMRQAICSTRVSKGPRCRLPRQPNIVVAIKVRGRLLYLKNTPQLLTLALWPGEERKTLKWFLHQLQKDIAATGPVPQHKRRRTTSADPRDSQAFEKSPEQQLVEQHVKALAERQDCKSAVWLASRGAMRVRSNKGTGKEFTVLGLSAARRSGKASVETLENLFDAMVVLAMQWLDTADKQVGEADAGADAPREPEEPHDPHDDEQEDEASNADEQEHEEEEDEDHEESSSECEAEGEEENWDSERTSPAGPSVAGPGPHCPHGEPHGAAGGAAEEEDAELAEAEEQHDP